MPTYEYACTSCGEHVEVVQSFRDEPLTVCPACGSALRKVFGSIGVVFKGSGFYKTDSRSGSKPEKSDRPDKSEKTDKVSAKSPDSSAAKSEGSSSSADSGSKSDSKKSDSSKSPSSKAAAS